MADPGPMGDGSFLMNILHHLDPYFSGGLKKPKYHHIRLRSQTGWIL